MADTINSSNLSGEFKTLSSSQIGSGEKNSIGEYGLTEQNIDTTFPTTSKPEIKVFGTSQIGESKIGISQNSSQSGSSQASTSQISSKQTSISQISSIQTGIEQNSTSQIRSGEIGISKISIPQNSTNQTGIGKIGSNEMFGTQIESHQIGIAEIFLPVSKQIINLFGIYPSVGAAYKAFEKVVGVSKVSLYAKINGLEPRLSQALVRYSSEQLSSVVAEFTQASKIVLPGYEVRIIDGNHIGGTEHRLKVLRP